ncbi:hypothetical protein BpHYR1_039138, partial [Brachionus plicatilis]
MKKDYLTDFYPYKRFSAKKVDRIFWRLKNQTAKLTGDLTARYKVALLMRLSGHGHELINLHLIEDGVFYAIALRNHKGFLFSEFCFNQAWLVTSISAPTKQCKTLSQIPGFKLLVIGDEKTNNSWYLKNAQFLSIDNQKNLGFKSYYSTPFNSYTRKNIGYLYAIKNGAQFIYDTDDDNAPTIGLESYFNFNKFYTGLVYDHTVTDRIINPYAHFGQPLIWPRGFPLDEIKNTYNNTYLLGAIKTSIVQQGVVNGDPDIDAIFRLTKKLKDEQIDIYFDDSAPSFQIPLYKMSPYNSQNTLFSYDGFWSLYLPNTVSFRLTDIWRSYWAQRLMWLLNE